MNHSSSFSKTKDFHSFGPTCFFLFPSAAVELFLILPSEIYTGVREVTHTPVRSAAHFPVGILLGFLSFLFGRDSATVLQQCLLVSPSYHAVVVFCKSFIKTQYFLGSLFMGINFICVLLEPLADWCM